MDVKTHPLLSKKGGNRVVALGNEAIVRGALEAGVGVVTTYPGTPSSEIGDFFARIPPEMGVYFEYSVNEKVALEVAAAAAIAGLRSLTAMKHVGVNVASDALMTLAYTGVRGGMVLLSADDPGCHSSQNEQDNRHYAKLGHIPMLEPSNVEECRSVFRKAFEISETLGLPVLVRTTTRVNHARGPILLGDLPETRRTAAFERDPRRFVSVPANSRENHKRLLERIAKAEEFAEASGFNHRETLGPKPTTGVISSGVASEYTREALRGHPVEMLRLGFTHPLPRKLVTDFLRSHERVIVIEELDTFLEEGVRALAQSTGLKTRILGKEDGLFPRFGELDADVVADGFVKAGVIPASERARFAAQVKLPARPPMLCPGCGHRAAAFAAKQASRREDAIYPVDIGCYTLTFAPPLGVGDLLLCMGSSVGTAAGLAKATGRRVIAFIGDSTFYHAGLPALINAVHNNHKFVLCIMDNTTTAMTGHQPTPESGNGGKRPVDMEALVRACGVEHVATVDPYQVKETTQAFRDALAHDGMAVVISRRPCVLLQDPAASPKKTYAVLAEKCTSCSFCIDFFGCPALQLGADKKAVIDPDLCSGCGVCAGICPLKAIVEVGGTA